MSPGQRILNHDKFGHKMRRHFSFDEDWVNLNHGSYGTYPASVADTRARIIRDIEKAPDKFLRYNYVSLLNESRQRVADLLHAPVDECVLVQNATTAIDLVLRNIIYEEKDVILYFDTTYAAVEKALLYIQETQPQVRLRKVGEGCSKQFQLPMDHDAICQLFTETILRVQAEGFDVKLAIFDTISSIPAVRMPFEMLTKVSKSHRILSLVDGAHGIGHFPLNLAQLDADFFVSNCHKWLFTPRACAVFHVPKRNQHLIRTTLPTSYFFKPQTEPPYKSQLKPDNTTRFVELFQFIATADNTPFYCISAALSFRDTKCGGEETIYEYIKQIAQRGADLISKTLETSVMGAQLDKTSVAGSEKHDPNISSYTNLRDCAMATMLLPIKVKGPDSPATDVGIHLSDAAAIASWMQKTLALRYNTSVSIFVYLGQLWVRVSGQVYLELSDFETLAGHLKDLCKIVEKGEVIDPDQMIR